MNLLRKVRHKSFVQAVASTCLLLITAFAGTVAAQEATEDSDTTVDQKETVSAQPVAVGSTQQQQKKSTPKIKAQSAENADSYEASEEISEDLSVSYPVDI